MYVSSRIFKTHGNSSQKKVQTSSLHHDNNMKIIQRFLISHLDYGLTLCKSGDDDDRLEGKSADHIKTKLSCVVSIAHSKYKRYSRGPYYSSLYHRRFKHADVFITLDVIQMKRFFGVY